jgi:hypothetical protein
MQNYFQFHAIGPEGGGNNHSVSMSTFAKVYSYHAYSLKLSSPNSFKFITYVFSEGMISECPLSTKYMTASAEGLCEET